MKGSYEKNLVSFNLKEDFFETPYLQNAPYPHGIHHAYSPSSDPPLPRSLDVIYLHSFFYKHMAN